MSIHVRGTYHTDPRDPDGECLYRLEVWPIPQELVPGLNIALGAEAKRLLRAAGVAGPWETDLTAKGTAQ